MAKTEVDSQRDQARYSAEAAIKKHSAVHGKAIEKMMGKNRCAKVDGIVVFQQSSRRSGELGTFIVPLSDLQL